LGFPRFPFLLEISMLPFDLQPFADCRMLTQSCGDNMTPQTYSRNYTTIATAIEVISDKESTSQRDRLALRIVCD
jgi:hypothetical protein